MKTSKLIRLTVVVAVMLCHNAAISQINTTTQSAESTALGGCLVWMDSGYARIDYCQPFVLASMSSKYIAVGLPLERSWAEFSFLHCGTAEYNEQSFSAWYGISISESLYLRVNGSLLMINADDPSFSSRHWVGAGIMARYVASEGLSFTGALRNCNWNDENPWWWSVNMIYSTISSWRVLMEISSEDCLRFRAGAEYLYNRIAALRIGVSSAPITLSVGGGVKWRNLSLDASVVTNRWLGVTPQTTLTVWF